VAVVDEAKVCGVGCVARQYGIPVSSLTSWMEQELELKQLLQHVRITFTN
jgi:hypothetical protein